MTSSSFAGLILTLSLFVSLGAYLFLSKREDTYLNILTPSFVISIPGYYLLPLFFNAVFGTDATAYAYVYVYSTLALENVILVYAYTRPTKRLFRLPFRYSYHNFDWFAFGFLGLALTMYLPVLLQFPEYLLDPRQIYAHTRTGFGINFYISSTFAYLAVILILFSRRSWRIKGSVILAASIILSLHGSKGQLLTLVALVALFEVYVNGRRLNFFQSLIAGLGISLFVLLLFAATMTLSDSPSEALEQISQYSDYTRNAMLVIDSHFPLQYGRLTIEGQTIGRIPRLLMPNKPKNFGALYLDDQFYPGSMDADAGAPDFGIGVQYADFGVLAIVYIAVFAMFRGWLARIFVGRLHRSHHPADFLIFAFIANVSIFPVGGVGWLLPEAIVVAGLLCFLSRMGAAKVYRERLVFKPHISRPQTNHSATWDPLV
jgi:hypothetical protein